MTASRPRSNNTARKKRVLAKGYTKVPFLLEVLLGHFRRRDIRCPYCGNSISRLVIRRSVLLECRKCPKCGIFWRHPKTLPLYLGKAYTISTIGDDLTYLTPDPTELRRLMSTSFVGTDKWFGEKIEIVKRYRSRGKLLDYGCSWGYGIWQFKKAGFDVMGYEVCEARAEFGRRNMGVEIVSDVEQLESLPTGMFDIIFCHHVFEHLHDPYPVLERFKRLINADGIVVIFSPNCEGLKNSETAKIVCRRLLCEGHILGLTVDFFEKNLPKHGFRLIASEIFDYEWERSYFKMHPSEGKLLGAELMVIAVREDAKYVESY